MSSSTAGSEDQLEEEYVVLANTVVADTVQNVTLETARQLHAPPPSPPLPPTPDRRRDTRHDGDRKDVSTDHRRNGDNHHRGSHHSRRSDTPFPNSRRHNSRPHSSGHFVADSPRQQDQQKEQTQTRNRRRFPGGRSSSEVDQTTHELGRGWSRILEDLVDDDGDSVDAVRSTSLPFAHRSRDRSDRPRDLDPQNDLDSQDKADKDRDGRPPRFHSRSDCNQARLAHHKGPRKPQAKKAFSDSGLGVRDGSGSHAHQGQGQSEETFCEGENGSSTSFDPSMRGSCGTVLHIRNMSDYHMSVFPQEDADELQCVDPNTACQTSSTGQAGDGCSEHAVDPGNGQGTMELSRTFSPMSLVSELVGGLDSQIRALCRNLEVLIMRRGPEPSPSPEKQEGKEKGESSKGSTEKSPKNSSKVDGGEESDRCNAEEGHSSVDKPKESTDDSNTKQDGKKEKRSTSLSSKQPLVPARGIPSEKELSKTEEQANEWLEIAAAAAGHPKQPPRPPPRPPKTLPPLLAEQSNADGRGRPVTLKSGSDGVCQQKQQKNGGKQESGNKTAGQTQSMVTLPPRAKPREQNKNVFEISTESSSDSVDDKNGSVREAWADWGKGGAGGRGGRGLDKLLSRELSQVFDQSDVLKSMWNNHKMQLCDLLASREREAARAERLEQALVRTRHLVSSLRRQRRDLHRYLEQKEEEWSTALRCHRNEAAFLRRKVLAGLEEKKDPKRDGKMASVLDSLLSLHMDREQFLALDLAKQNKIHELKLLAVRQQLALEELKERNSDLNHALSSLLQCLPGSVPHQSRASHASQRHSPAAGPGGGSETGPKGGPGLTDLLYCDRAAFLPHHPTAPDLAALAVFSVGGEQSPIPSPVEAVFDASRQRCYADGDHYDHNGDTTNSDNDSRLAEELLRELTLYGPGSPDFTLAEADDRRDE